VVLARGQKEHASSADLTEQKQVLPLYTRTRLRRLRVPFTGFRQHLRRGLNPQNAEHPSVTSSKHPEQPLAVADWQHLLAWTHPTERRTTFCYKFEIRTETSLPASSTGSPYVSSNPRQTLRTQSPTPKSRATLGRHSDAVSDPKRQKFSKVLF
jgi:hypothetical protein